MSEILNKAQNKLNLIVCHLGNGASVTCIKDGKSFDTSMGLTPLAGLIMGTRSGDIDSGIVDYMTDQLGTDVHTITSVLNKESGMKGISGISADMRDVEAEYYKNNPRAILAFKMYSQTAADFIVKYANYLNGQIDAIVFTAGIGENSSLIKQMIIDKTSLLSLKLDENANQEKYQDYQLISSSESRYPIYKVRTDEETMIC
jgi:acetate kinase